MDLKLTLVMKLLAFALVERNSKSHILLYSLY